MVSQAILSNLMGKFHKHFKKINYKDVEKYFKLSEKEKIFCEYCKEELLTDQPYPYLKVPSIDHKKPTYAGGYNSFDNIAICCHRCNICKGTMDSETYQKMLDALNNQMDKEARDIILKQLFGGRFANKMRRLEKEKEIRKELKLHDYN